MILTELLEIQLLTVWYLHLYRNAFLDMVKIII